MLEASAMQVLWKVLCCVWALEQGSWFFCPTTPWWKAEWVKGTVKEILAEWEARCPVQLQASIFMKPFKSTLSQHAAPVGTRAALLACPAWLAHTHRIIKHWAQSSSSAVWRMDRHSSIQLPSDYRQLLKQSAFPH